MQLFLGISWFLNRNTHNHTPKCEQKCLPPIIFGILVHFFQPKIPSPVPKALNFCPGNNRKDSQFTAIPNRSFPFFSLHFFVGHGSLCFELYTLLWTALPRSSWYPWPWNKVTPHIMSEIHLSSTQSKKGAPLYSVCVQEKKKDTLVLLFREKKFLAENEVIGFFPMSLKNYIRVLSLFLVV